MAQKRHRIAFTFDELFESVNRDCFGGKLPKPTIVWSARRARKQMGAYNYQTDTLSINPVLNEPDTPRYALEFLLFHELLHKALGFTVQNNRRSFHGKEFKQYEQRHPYHHAAQRYFAYIYLKETLRLIEQRINSTANLPRQTAAVRAERERFKRMKSEIIERLNEKIKEITPDLKKFGSNKPK